ncbi:MAG: hypothetical protein KDD45_18105 [Bdellovibrionales bacterium]|nr:hypothetical protein [Bdellovibrionales bacterium]
MERAKSPYSETMSTSSSRTKSKDKIEKQQHLKISDFALGKKLGEGKFGAVFVAQHRQSGFICAMKRIYRSSLDEKMMQQLVR